MSYANVVKENVKKVKGNQVENYPWEPTVSVNRKTDNYGTNQVFKNEKSRVVNTLCTDLKIVSNATEKLVPGTSINIKCRNVDGNQ